MDYFLSNTAAGQDVNGPCIDTGIGDVEEGGMQYYSTRTDFLPDTGKIDMGFHYRIGPRLVMDVEEAPTRYSVLLSASASRFIEAEVDLYLAAFSSSSAFYTFSGGVWHSGLAPLITGLCLEPGQWHGPVFITDIPKTTRSGSESVDYTLQAAFLKAKTLEFACEPEVFDELTIE